MATFDNMKTQSKRKINHKILHTGPELKVGLKHSYSLMDNFGVQGQDATRSEKRQMQQEMTTK